MEDCISKPVIPPQKDLRYGLQVFPLQVLSFVSHRQHCSYHQDAGIGSWVIGSHCKLVIIGITLEGWYFPSRGYLSRGGVAAERLLSVWGQLLLRGDTAFQQHIRLFRYWQWRQERHTHWRHAPCRICMCDPLQYSRRGSVSHHNPKVLGYKNNLDNCLLVPSFYLLCTHSLTTCFCTALRQRRSTLRGSPTTVSRRHTTNSWCMQGLKGLGRCWCRRRGTTVWIWVCLRTSARATGWWSTILAESHVNPR